MKREVLKKVKTNVKARKTENTMNTKENKQQAKSNKQGKIKHQKTAKKRQIARKMNDATGRINDWYSNRKALQTATGKYNRTRTRKKEPHNKKEPIDSKRTE